MDQFFQLSKVIWAALTAPASDISHIKAAYEGLLGAAGPNIQVISIRKCAPNWRALFSLDEGRRVYRYYQLELQRLDGTTFFRTIGVEFSLVGSGEVIEV